MSNVPFNTVSPLSYGDWLKYQDAINPENEQSGYFEYLQSWYKNQKTVENSTTINVKQQYIQLAKDLSYLFGSAEGDNPFLKDIDYSNDEDIIYAIPFFAQKLRQIAIVLKNKRESVKKA